jgi:hypothetical protein
MGVKRENGPLSIASQSSVIPCPRNQKFEDSQLNLFLSEHEQALKAISIAVTWIRNMNLFAYTVQKSKLLTFSMIYIRYLTYKYWTRALKNLAAIDVANAMCLRLFAIENCIWNYHVKLGLTILAISREKFTLTHTYINAWMHIYIGYICYIHIYICHVFSDCRRGIGMTTGFIRSTLTTRGYILQFPVTHTRTNLLSSGVVSRVVTSQLAAEPRL